MVYLVGAVGQAQGPRHQGCPRPRGGMANLANRGAKAPTGVSDQQDCQKGLQAAVRECQGVSPRAATLQLCKQLWLVFLRNRVHQHDLPYVVPYAGLLVAAEVHNLLDPVG